MTPSPAAVDRATRATALWARSLAINALALVICRLSLAGFEIRGFSAYVLAAVGIELPTLVWWLAVRLRPQGAPALLLALALVLPVVLATSVPGLLVAEWISPLRIQGFWTYVAASSITAALTIGLRQSRPLRFMRAFLAGPPEDGPTSQTASG